MLRAPTSTNSILRVHSNSEGQRKMRERGQILPTALLLLVILLVFVAVNLQRTKSGVDRVRRQRIADQLALQANNEQARALNAIATLNEAISIMVSRAYFFSFALAGLAACALTLAPSCVAGMARAADVAPRFFRKLHKLGQQIREFQDAIRDWGQKAPKQVVQRHNLIQFQKWLSSEKKENAPLHYAFLYPKEPVLGIKRGKSFAENIKPCLNLDLDCLNIPENLGFPGLSLPKPYALNSEGPRITIGIVEFSPPSPFERVFRSASISSPRRMWSLSLSEAKVDGEGLEKAGFQSMLVPFEPKAEKFVEIDQSSGANLFGIPHVNLPFKLPIEIPLVSIPQSHEYAPNFQNISSRRN